MLDWISALEQFTPDEIRMACREWVRENPRRRPNFGDIRGLILDARAVARSALRQPEPEPYSALTVPTRERVEAADRIMRAAFGTKRMGQP